MKKIIKRVLRENLKSNELQQAYDYISNYMDGLEILREKGDIWLCERGSNYAKVWINRRKMECLVAWSFWHKLYVLFSSLEEHDFQSLISKWVEKNFQLEDFYVKSSKYIDGEG